VGVVITKKWGSDNRWEGRGGGEGWMGGKNDKRRGGRGGGGRGGRGGLIFSGQSKGDDRKGT